MDNTSFIMYALGGIVVAFLVRDALCWFWKINKIVARLESIDSQIRKALETHDTSEQNS